VSHLSRYQQHFRTLESLRPPRIMRAVAWLLIGAISATVAFVALTPWVQTTAGPGLVTTLNPEDRVQNINALVSGRIEKWFVRDGSQVRAGDPIVQITDNDPNLIDRLQAERAQVSAKLRAAEAALATARLDLRRQQQLYEEGLASRRDYELAQIKVSQFEASVAEAAAERNRVDIGLSRQSAQLLTAPRDGRILSLNAGDAATAVSAGDVLATFIPTNAPLAVELYIPGRDAPLVRPGRKVRLQFEGWPAVQFSGWPSVAVGTFGGRVLSVDPSASPNGQFRLLVVPDPEEPPWPDSQFIRFGAKVQGWVLLEEVTVGFEIWRQLNNFPPAVPADVRGEDGPFGAPTAERKE
jgi:multidrug efflux pump subunit AcrA (membrane-fusion protein)